MTLTFPTRAASLSQAATDIIKSATKEKLNWQSVDVDTLPKEFATLYANYKQASVIASEHRTAFEDAICGPLAKMLNAKPGQDVAFGYRFGQLSVALTDKRIPTAKANTLRF